MNVTLNREASWATSRDGLIFGRLDASPVVSGAVTNARIGAEGARHAPLCAAMTIHRHGNAMTIVLPSGLTLPLTFSCLKLQVQILTDD